MKLVMLLVVIAELSFAGFDSVLEDHGYTSKGSAIAFENDWKTCFAIEQYVIQSYRERSRSIIVDSVDDVIFWSKALVLTKQLLFRGSVMCVIHFAFRWSEQGVFNLKEEEVHSAGW